MTTALERPLAIINEAQSGELTNGLNDRQLSLQELLDLSLGVPEVGAVNFRMLKAFLAALMGNLGVTRELSGVTNMTALSMVGLDDVGEDDLLASATVASEQYIESSAHDEDLHQSVLISTNSALAVADEKAETIIELSPVPVQTSPKPRPPSADTPSRPPTPTIIKPPKTDMIVTKRSSVQKPITTKVSRGNNVASSEDLQRRRSSGLTRLQQLIQPAINTLQERLADVEKKLFILENFPNASDIVPSLGDAMNAETAAVANNKSTPSSILPTSSSSAALVNANKPRASQVWQQMKIGQRVDGIERAVEKLFSLTDNVVHEMTEQMRTTAKLSRREAVVTKLLAITGYRRFVANTDDEHLFDETPQSLEEHVRPSGSNKPHTATPSAHPVHAASSSPAYTNDGPISSSTTPSMAMSRYGVSTQQQSPNRLSPPNASGRTKNDAVKTEQPLPRPSSSKAVSSAISQIEIASNSTPGLYFKDYGFVPANNIEHVLPAEVINELSHNPRLVALIRDTARGSSVNKLAPKSMDRKNINTQRDDTGKTESASYEHGDLQQLAAALQLIVPHYAPQFVVATRDGRLFSEAAAAPTSASNFVEFQPSYAAAPIVTTPEQLRSAGNLPKISLVAAAMDDGKDLGGKAATSSAAQLRRAASASPHKPSDVTPNNDNLLNREKPTTENTGARKRPRHDGEQQQQQQQIRPLKKRYADSHSTDPSANATPSEANLYSQYSNSEPTSALGGNNNNNNDESIQNSRNESAGSDLMRALPVMTWDAFLNGIKRGFRSHNYAQNNAVVGTVFASPPPGEVQDVLEQLGRMLNNQDTLVHRLHELENELDQTRDDWDLRVEDADSQQKRKHEDLLKLIGELEGRFEKHVELQLEETQTVNSRLAMHDSHINHLRSLLEGMSATVDYQAYQVTRAEQQQQANAEELREHVNVKLQEQADSLVQFIYRQSGVDLKDTSSNQPSPTAAAAATDDEESLSSGKNAISDELTADDASGQQTPAQDIEASKSQPIIQSGDKNENESSTLPSSQQPANPLSNVRMEDFTKLRNNFSAHRRDFLEFERLIYNQMSLLRTRCDDILKDMLRRVRPSSNSSPDFGSIDGSNEKTGLKRSKSLNYDFEQALSLAIQDVEKLQHIVEELSTNDQLLGTKMRTLAELISRLDDAKASNDFVEHLSGRKADRYELIKKVETNVFEGTVKNIKRDVEQLDQFFHHFEHRVDKMVQRLRDNLANKLDKSDGAGGVQSQLVERFRSMESLVKSMERFGGDDAARAAGTHRPLACISCDKPAMQEHITGIEAALGRHELRLTNVMANGVIKPYIEPGRRDEGCSDKDFNEATLARVAHERNVARLLAAQQSWAARWRTEWFDGPPGYPSTGPAALEPGQRWRRICGGDHTTVDKKAQFLRDKDLLTIMSLPVGAKETSQNSNTKSCSANNSPVGRKKRKAGHNASSSSNCQNHQKSGAGKLMRGLPSTKQKLMILAAQQASAKISQKSARSTPQSNRSTPVDSPPAAIGQTSSKAVVSFPLTLSPTSTEQQPQQLMLTSGELPLDSKIQSQAANDLPQPSIAAVVTETVKV